MRRWTAAERDVERLLREGIDPPDARLLHQFLHDRDESAFEVLVDRHGPLVLSLCRRYLRDPSDVEDAFQATFLVLVRKGPGLRDRDALASWLYGVARRTALRARSNALTRRDREGGRPEALDEAPAEPSPPFDDTLETLDEELARLPDKYRAPLILCHLKGRTYDQAAAELGCPPGTVRSRTARARALLRSRLMRRGVDASAYLPLLRPEPAVPPSLVAATVAAVGRFPASPNGPVAALAEGVIAAMSLSPSKLLKFAFGLIVGTAAAGSVVLGAYVAQGGASPPGISQSVDVSAKAGNTSATKTAQEGRGGLDRIVDLPSSPKAIRPVHIASDVLSDLTSTASGAGDLREIEAELLNAYPAYRDILDGVQQVVARSKQAAAVSGPKVDMEAVEKKVTGDPAVRAAISSSKERIETTVKPVRLLLARLLGMKDRRTDMEQAIGDRLGLLERLSREMAKMDREYEAVFARTALDSATDRRRLELQLGRLTDEIDRAREAVAAAQHDLTRLQLAIKPLDRQAADVDRLIRWTREHFKEARLTIDDAPTDAKSD